MTVSYAKVKVRWTFGRLTVFDTATSQGLLDGTH